MSRTKLLTACPLLIAVVAATLLWTPAKAADKLLLTGLEGTPHGSSYAFLGIVAPVGKTNLGNGWVQRYWLDYLTYKYTKDGVQHDATAPGLEAALGYQQSSPEGWAGFYVGALYRQTDISPDDSDSRSAGGKLRMKVQAEGERLLDDSWRLNGIASYVTGQQAYWIRGRLMHGREYSVGGEFIVHGDPDYQALQLGAVLVMRRTRDVAIGFKAGAQRLHNEGATLYLGAELSRVF